LIRAAISLSSLVTRRYLPVPVILLAKYELMSSESLFLVKSIRATNILWSAEKTVIDITRRNSTAITDVRFNIITSPTMSVNPGN
jgi:hypothetical protein